MHSLDRTWIDMDQVFKNETGTITASPIEPGYKNTNRTKVWFVTSVRVIPKSQRKPWFDSWWNRNILPFKRTIWKIGGERRKLSWSQFYQEFIHQWKDHHQERFPIDCRTWGFYLDRETALKAARENWSDMREAAYYKYVVVEGVEEGIYSIVDEEDQFFFKWVNDYIEDDKGRWEPVSEPPEELVNHYKEHHVMFQFTSF